MSGKTIRVRGVPRSWNANQLQSFLQEQDETANPVVKGLAPEINGQSSTATVSFDDVSAISQALQPGQTREFPLPHLDHRARPECLTLDVDFFGVTTLFCPLEEDHKIDVVAILGLGGHVFGLFKERSGEHMWLRDALSYDLTSETDNKSLARVMIYGYESGIAGSTSMQNLEDMASSFYNSLLSLAAQPQSRSILLVAHSLGGLIVKQALISLAKSEGDEDQKLLKAIYGIVFFGVPHDGMDTQHLLPMVGNGPNRFLIESINDMNSQILSIQQREFHDVLGPKGEAEIFCFYETKLSPTPQQDETGKWASTGQVVALVTKGSATHCRQWEAGAEHMCAINRTHSEMVKFKRHDDEYDKARGRMIGLARRAAMRPRQRQPPGVHFIVPYIKNPHFVGRSDAMEQLKQQLGFGQRPESTSSRPRVALHGLGGVGKTQVAIAYVFWLRDQCPDVSVFWIHASSVERFQQSFFHIAQTCRIPGYDDPNADMLALVKNWLETRDNRRWLMVVDNADDTEIFFNQPDATTNAKGGNLARYLSDSTRGSLLITTRNKQAAIRLTNGDAPIMVGPMKVGDCQTLLRTRLDGNAITEADLSKLSSRLEHLPLALVQAAAFIRENSITMRHYFELQDMSDQNLVDLLSEEFETAGRDSETPRAVAQTWMISFQQIKRDNILAGQLLSFMSLLDRQDIPKEFIACYSKQGWNETLAETSTRRVKFKKTWRQLRAFFPSSREKRQDRGPSDEIELTKALGLLKSFCFIAEEKSGSFDMHRLVQLVTRKWLASLETISQFRREALMTVSHLYPFGKFETRATCASYLSHANAILSFGEFGARDELKAKASLLHCIAAYVKFEGNWSDAEELNIEARGIRRELFGENHPSTLASMSNLALIYEQQGRWEEAEKLTLQVMETRKMKLGADHPDTLTNAGNLALALWKQGRLREAEELQVQVMEARKIKLGADHPNTLTSMANLASTFWSQSRWEEAEKLEVQVMEACKIKLGADHPNTLSIMDNLASTFWSQGRLEEAEKLEVQVMEARKMKLGADHPDTLTSMNNLASIYTQQGRCEEAEKLHLQVMETCKIKLGADHPNTLTSMANLAHTWQSMGRSSDAVDLMRACVRLHHVKLGPAHPITQACISALEDWQV